MICVIIALEAGLSPTAQSSRQSLTKAVSMVIAMLPSSTYQVRRVQVMTGTGVRTRYNAGFSCLAQTFWTIIYAALVLLSGFWLGEHVHLGISSNHGTMNQGITLSVKAVPRRMQVIEQEYSDPMKKSDISSMPRVVAQLMTTTSVDPEVRQDVSTGANGLDFAPAPFDLWFLNMREGYSISLLSTCAGGDLDLKEGSYLSYQVESKQHIVKIMGAGNPQIGDNNLYVMAPSLSSTQIWLVEWDLRYLAKSSYANRCLAQAEEFKLAEQSATTHVISICRWQAVCDAYGLPIPYQQRSNLTDHVGTNLAPFLSQNLRGLQMPFNSSKSATSRLVEPSSLFHSLYLSFRRTFYPDFSVVSQLILRHASSWFSFLGIHSVSPNYISSTGHARRLGAQKSNIDGSSRNAYMLVGDAQKHNGTSSASQAHGSGAHHYSSICLPFGHDCYVTDLTLQDMGMTYCGEHGKPCSEDPAVHAILHGVLYYHGQELEYLHEHPGQGCSHGFFQAVMTGLIVEDMPHQDPCDNFGSSTTTQSVTKGVAQTTSAPTSPSKPHGDDNDRRRHHDTRRRRAIDNVRDYEEKHSCKQCLQDDECPTSYRSWCQSSQEYSWLAGLTIAAWAVNVVICTVPTIVMVLGFMAWSGQRGCTAIGRGALTATDYFRGTLCWGFLFFLLTNLLHDPAGGHTVLDTQFSNPRLTNYLGLWFSIDTLASAVILVVDAGAGFCGAAAHEELSDYLLCTNGSGLSWLYALATVLTLCEILILAGAPPP